MGTIQVIVTDIEQKIEEFLLELKDKTVAELQALYAEAQVVEAKLRTEVVILRQRAANLATEIEVDAELAVIEAKSKLAEALAWLKALEQKLFGTDAVKDFNTGAKHGDA